jgi:hypothetical protein
MVVLWFVTPGRLRLKPGARQPDSGIRRTALAIATGVGGGAGLSTIGTVAPVQAACFSAKVVGKSAQSIR